MKKPLEVQRYDIINHLIKVFNYQSYLEIGVRDPGANFDKIQCPFKESIDPNPRGQVTYLMTSDEAFELILKKGQKYDIIFVDGLHLMEQTDKDIINSLEALNVNGTIVMHDCSPTTELAQREEYAVMGEFPIWNGTVWKSYVKLRNRLDLSMEVVDTDWGCGIIRLGSQRVYYHDQIKPEYLTYPYLAWHRKELLNLISVDEFKERYP